MLSEKSITVQSLEFLSALIPELYQERIKAGTLIGSVFLDAANDDAVVGVVLSSIKSNMLNIEWVSTTDEYSSVRYIGEIISARADATRLSGLVSGVFSEFSVNETHLADGFSYAMFDVSKRPGNVVVTTLGNIRSELFYNEKSVFNDYVDLKDANNKIRNSMATLVNTHDLPLPLSIPVDWSEYDPELSCFHLSGPTPDSLLLMSKQDDELNLEFAFSTDSIPFIKILGYTIRKLKKIYPPTQSIRISVLDPQVSTLIEKMIIDPQRDDLMRATLYFRAGTFPKYIFKEITEQNAED